MLSWVRALVRRRALDREMREEMQRHLDLATERFVRRGMAPDDARRAARREFGNVAGLEESGREARGAARVESVARDVRHAWRMLRAGPGFAAVAIASLAIGIGANTAIFSLIDAVILKALPVQHPDELALVRIKDPLDGSNPGFEYFTNPVWEQLRDRTGASATYAVSSSTSVNLASGGEERRAAALWVNGDFFNTLGLLPSAGRLLTVADDQRGCPATVVASYGFWQTELGARRDAIGKPISLSGQPFLLIGVMQPGFSGVDIGESYQLYMPLCAEAVARGTGSALDRRSSWWIRVLARPKPGTSLAQYNAMVRVAARGIFESTVPQQWSAKEQAEYRTRLLAAAPAANGLSRVRTNYSKALWVLMGMVGIILLISCANVANLLLARGAARSREIAIRIALGASRARLMRQFLTESAMLALIGAIVGAAIATWGSRFLVGMLDAGPAMPIAIDLSLDWRVMGFTAAVSVATVLLFGLAPAWRATRVDPQSAMKAQGRGMIDGHSRFRIGKALVVAQSALALVLVVGAGLLVTTFRHLATTDTGFKADGVLITRVNLKPFPPRQYLAVQRQLLGAFRAIPGVRAASTADITPVSGSSSNDEVFVDGYRPAKPDDAIVWFNSVSDAYFRTMGTRIVSGRDFGPEDVPSSTPVAIVNQVVVNRFFRGASPIGKTYHVTVDGHPGPATTIIGVAEVSKYNTLREPAQPIIYVTSLQDSAANGSMTYLLRASGSPSAIIADVKAVTARVDPRISLTFRALSEQVANALQRERMLAMLSGFFGAVAVLLAMIGLYGVMAYTVARRRVEIGIRIALGAVRARVVRLVLGDVALMISIGIAIGTAGAFAVTRLLKTLLFGVTPTDPVTLIGGAVGLALAALVAGVIPARRAARLEPVEALRED
jgi:putative ABC transport system permease protein